MDRRFQPTIVCIAVAALAVACSNKGTARTDSVAVTPSVAPAPTPATAPIAVTEVAVGKHIGSDKHVVAPTDAFGVRDTIFASVITMGAGQNAKLTARWMYQGKQVVTESDQTISPTGGSAATEFHIQKATGWPKGEYSVQILLNGVVANTKTFRVS